MKKIVELPLVEPLYGTYHNGIVTACIGANPSIRNWVLSNTMILTCNRKFLTGFTTPEIMVENFFLHTSPFLETDWFCTRFLKGSVNSVIRNMIDEGYYVYFTEVDDYYVKGKSWYKERHFRHDGTICGYNQVDKTFCIYAYDSKWRFQKFWTPQASFNKGREAMVKNGVLGFLCAVKPRMDKIEFCVKSALNGIMDYLNSDMINNPEEGEGNVRGIVVHEYIAKYIDKLLDESIPYEKMDRRIFRLIWEHKKVMLERIEMIEKILSLNNEISSEYKFLVEEANTMRMLYASHHRKRRDSVLITIKKKLLALSEKEQALLTALVKKAEKQSEI